MFTNEKKKLKMKEIGIRKHTPRRLERYLLISSLVVFWELLEEGTSVVNRFLFSG